MYIILLLHMRMNGDVYNHCKIHGSATCRDINKLTGWSHLVEGLYGWAVRSQAENVLLCEQHNMITSAEAERTPFSHLTLGGSANLIDTDYDGTEISKN